MGHGGEDTASVPCLKVSSYMEHGSSLLWASSLGELWESPEARTAGVHNGDGGRWSPLA